MLFTLSIQILLKAYVLFCEYLKLSAPICNVCVLWYCKILHMHCIPPCSDFHIFGPMMKAFREYF